jgi:nitroreductase
MVRSFSGRAVPSETLERVLVSSRRAPAAGNTDGWDAVVLRGPEQTDAFWQATTTAEWRESSRRWPGLSRAPVVVCVFSHPGSYLDRYDEPDKRGSGLGHPEGEGGGQGSWPVPFWFVDAGFGVLIMLLSATDAGLGACFLGNFRGEVDLCNVLGVPPGRRFLGAVLMGEPGEKDPPSPSLHRTRRPAEAVFHYGHW